MKIHRGMTPDDVLEILGSPVLKTFDGSGREVWTYQGGAVDGAIVTFQDEKLIEFKSSKK